MTEKHLILEQADPAVFFGPGNANLRMLRALCPKLRIIGRDSVVKVVGDEEEIGHFETLFTARRASSSIPPAASPSPHAAKTSSASSRPSAGATWSLP